MLGRRLILPDKLRELFGAMEPDLIRYPAIDANAFREAVLVFLDEGRDSDLHR